VKTFILVLTLLLNNGHLTKTEVKHVVIDHDLDRECSDLQDPQGYARWLKQHHKIRDYGYVCIEVQGSLM
jgi:hypothetical protein